MVVEAVMVIMITDKIASLKIYSLVILLRGG